MIETPRNVFGASLRDQPALPWAAAVAAGLPVPIVAEDIDAWESFCAKVKPDIPTIVALAMGEEFSPLDANVFTPSLTVRLLAWWALLWCDALAPPPVSGATPHSFQSRMEAVALLRTSTDLTRLPPPLRTAIVQLTSGLLEEARQRALGTSEGQAPHDVFVSLTSYSLLLARLLPKRKSAEGTQIFTTLLGRGKASFTPGVSGSPTELLAALMTDIQLPAIWAREVDIALALMLDQRSAAWDKPKRLAWYSSKVAQALEVRRDTYDPELLTWQITRFLGTEAQWNLDAAVLGTIARILHASEYDDLLVSLLTDLAALSHPELVSRLKVEDRAQLVGITDLRARVLAIRLGQKPWDQAADLAKELERLMTTGTERISAAEQVDERVARERAGAWRRLSSLGG